MKSLQWKIKIIEAVINSWCAGQFEETGWNM